jgi:hypothetical protein
VSAAELPGAFDASVRREIQDALIDGRPTPTDVWRLDG